MAGSVHVFEDGHLTIGAFNVSDQLQSIQTNFSVAELDARAMGDDSMVKEPGLKDFQLTADFLADFDDNQLDETLWGLYDNRTKATIVFRPDSGAVSATNPQYGFTGFLSSYNPGGAHGELVSGSLTLSISSSVTRVTS